MNLFPYRQDKNQAHGDDKDPTQRRDFARESTLGDPAGLPGSGADLASQDMEIPNPSPS